MGFALWVKDDLSWAAGTHEYRPMGVAIIAANGRYRARDFDSRRVLPSKERRAFAGFFASLDHMNEYLEKRSGAGGKGRKPGRARKRGAMWIF
jgi:hypothetical protein